MQQATGQAPQEQRWWRKHINRLRDTIADAVVHTIIITVLEGLFKVLRLWVKYLRSDDDFMRTAIQKIFDIADICLIGALVLVGLWLIVRAYLQIGMGKDLGKGKE